MLPVTSVTYQTLASGPLSGALAFVIKLGGKKEVPYDKLIKKMESVPHRSKSVLIDTSSLSEDQHLELEKELFDFATTLTEKGFIIIALFSGLYRPSYLSVATYRIAKISAGPWVEMDCNELWVTIENDSEEPPVGNNHLQKGTLLYIDMTNSKIKGDILFAFLGRARFEWRVLSNQKVYQINIPLE